MSKKTNLIKRLVRLILWLTIVPILLVGAFMAFCELWVFCSGGLNSTAQLKELDEGRVALVLGCSRYLGPGRENYYFIGRMDAAAELWHSGKVRGFIVSGDNRALNYNEPISMRKALMERGVPPGKIRCDYAGLRTLDSVIRAQEIFGAQKICIVSQDWHVRRAVTTARFYGIDAVGYEAPLAPTGRANRAKHFLRERGSRVLMVWDLISGKEPQHLGQREQLPF